jgi:hypothetical protein
MLCSYAGNLVIELCSTGVELRNGSLAGCVDYVPLPRLAKLANTIKVMSVGVAQLQEVLYCQKVQDNLSGTFSW